MEKIIQGQLDLAAEHMAESVAEQDWAEVLRWSARIEALEDVLTEIEALNKNVVQLRAV